MKVFGHGAFENRELALRYSLGLPGVSLAIIGLDNEQQIDEVVQLATDYRPISDDERDQLIEEVRPIVEKDAKESDGTLFWLHDTAVMGWQKHDEPVAVRY
jgi:predicted aldo/keto reductase-like oxidoreductase